MIWTTKWPDEPGWYWFFGDPFGALDVNRDHVRNYTVRVSQASNAMMYVCEGHFLYQSEASPGFWTPMVVPPVPDEENITDD